MERKAQSAEEMGKENHPLIRSRGRKKFPCLRKLVRDVLGQISGLPKLFDLTLHDGGSHPLAPCSGHLWSRLRTKGRTWALELECARDGWAQEEEGVGEKGGSHPLI